MPGKLSFISCKLQQLPVTTLCNVVHCTVVLYHWFTSAIAYNFSCTQPSRVFNLPLDGCLSTLISQQRVWPNGGHWMTAASHEKSPATPIASSTLTYNHFSERFITAVQAQWFISSSSTITKWSYYMHFEQFFKHGIFWTIKKTKKKYYNSVVL